MRIAFLSDIHSNLQALEAVLDRIGTLGADRVVCLGDIVGYAAQPRETLQLVRKRADLCLVGNHDWAVLHGTPTTFNASAAAGIAHSRDELTPDDLVFLRNLTAEARDDVDGCDLFCFHASPYDALFEYWYPPQAASHVRALSQQGGRDSPVVLASGHTHLPMHVTAGPVPGPRGDIRADLVRALDDVSRKAGIVAINPGSVGQPRDGDPRAAFALLDTDALEVAFHRVRYDVDAAAAAIRAAGLPDALATRLFEGR